MSVAFREPDRQREEGGGREERRSWIAKRAVLFAAILALTPALLACGADDLSHGSLGRSLTAEGAIRIVAANLSSGNRQSWDPGHGARILRAIDPDVILMQEFRFGDSSESALRRFVDSNFGPEFDFAREDATLANGIISRWPILRWGSWNDPEVNDREFVYAEIDLPGEKDLWAVSVHFVTASATRRRREAEALVAALDRLVPSDAMLVVGGDLNTKSESESAVRTLGRRLSTDRRPTDVRGNPNTNRSRSMPYDWVLPSPSLDAHQVGVEFGASSHPDGLVFDTRMYPSQTRISPAMTQDSGASGMQHVAVIRDFAIP